ncbi:MAG: DUF308 domain-containing protein [Ferruginibacter sp.]
MLPTIIKPWWAIILMGVLFIICAILIFNNPVATLLALSVWLGWLVILAGIAGIVSYFSSEKEERQNTEILIGIATVILGVFMISKTFLTMYAIIVLFAILMEIIGIWIVSYAWSARREWSYWWIAGILGVIIILIGIKSFWDIRAGAESISNFIGMGILFSGIGLIILGFIKNKIVRAMKKKVNSFKENSLNK